MYLTVEVPGVKVPLATNGVPEPERVIVRLEASKMPELIVKIEAIFISPAAVKVVPTWSRVRLL